MKPITTGVLLMGDLPASDLASLARRLEDWGYDYIWLADERFFREVYASLTLCALNTKKIELGVCVTDPYSRHPALTAMAISTLDEISDGRAVLGIGAGVSGFGELGIDRDRPALAMREMVGLVRNLLTSEQVDFQGRMVQFSHGALNFTPIRADLPIYVASNAPRGLQVAGELADGAIVSACAEEGSIDYAKALISKGTGKAGRDLWEIDLVARLNCCVSNDGQVARNAVRTATIRSLPGHLNFGTAAGMEVAPALAASLSQMGYTHNDAALADMAQRVPDHIIDAMTLAGTPEEVAQRVVRIVRRGVSQILVRPSPSGESGIDVTLEAFATQVMPVVRRELD
ncbi:MAG: hypothetical protein BZY81_05285 [SAR202 cluster bacterium Io17-Chloro-G4]|nr:MAG: hypothetical protein BZY81_05285 [SAR202 cluster bacterium Io17-Chloro-G4]